MIIFELLAVILGIFAVVLLISAVVGVPFLPTHQRQAELMMDLAGVASGKKVVDLGSGAGRLLFLAAARGAVATGYELNPFLCAWTLFVVRLRGLSEQVHVKCQSLYGADLHDVDIVVA